MEQAQLTHFYQCLLHEYNELLIKETVTKFNPYLSLKSDQHTFSPNKVNKINKGKGFES